MSVRYIKKLVFPILWLILMTSILVANIIPSEYSDYFFCLYFGGFFVYFVFITKDFSLVEFCSSIKNKRFWKQVLKAILWIGLGYGLGYLLEIILPTRWDISFSAFSSKRAYNIPTLIAFFFSTVLFPAMGQELFFRKSIIVFNSKASIIISTLIGSILFAMNDSLNLFGILISFLGGIGFSIPYIKTKNIYVCIVAHYFISFVFFFIFLLQK